MEDPRIELGRKVERARLAKGWSKEKAAREADISSITWKRIEDGLSVHDTKRFAALQVLGLNEYGDQPRPAPPLRTDPEFRAQVERANLSEENRRRILALLDAEEAAERAEADTKRDEPLTS